MIPQKECLYCDFRGEIKGNNRTCCNNPHEGIEATENASYYGYWNYPEDYAWQFKVTECCRWKKRNYGKE